MPRPRKDGTPARDANKRKLTELYVQKLQREPPARVTLIWDTTHLELRFYGTPSVRKQGFELATDLMEINPRLLFQRHIKLVDFDPEVLKQSQVRAAIRHDMAFYRGKETNAFTDKYRASIPRRVSSLVQRQCRDRVQQAKNVYPHHVKRLESISIDVLNLPDRLTWPL